MYNRTIDSSYDSFLYLAGDVKWKICPFWKWTRKLSLKKVYMHPQGWEKTQINRNDDNFLAFSLFSVLLIHLIIWKLHSSILGQTFNFFFTIKYENWVRPLKNRLMEHFQRKIDYWYWYLIMCNVFVQICRWR